MIKHTGKMTGEQSAGLFPIRTVSGLTGVNDERQNNWRRYINGMIAAIIRFDESALERTYAEALSHYPVRSVTEKLLSPVLKEIGERWVSGKGSVAEEHFFGQAN